jgi:hypothetical protein
LEAPERLHPGIGKCSVYLLTRLFFKTKFSKLTIKYTKSTNNKPDMIVIAELRMLKQEDYMSKVSLGYMRPCLKIQKKKKKGMKFSSLIPS